MSKNSLKRNPVALTGTRNIITRYYFRREERKINRSIHVDKAILNCIDHLAKNHYQASIAEILDEGTGKLHAVITRNMRGKITIVYKSDAVYVNDDSAVE